MTENRFFTWVWRFNGLAIAITVTLMLCIIVWQLTRDFRRAYFPTRTTEVLNVVPAEDAASAAPRAVQERPRFGSPQEPRTAGIYAVPQFVAQTYQNRGISKESGGNRVNFLVVNTAEQTTRWMFEGTSRLITDVQPIWHDSAGGARRFLGQLLHVIDKDSNGNAQLSRSDDGQLYFVPPDWSQAILLDDTLRSVLSVRSAGEDAFEVLYAKTGETLLRRFSLPDAEVAFQIDLSPEN